MITRKNRFHGYGSLRQVYRSGRMVRGPHFAVRSALNPRRRSYRVAVVVSRKVNKSAVTRNRIRRRLYELVREAGPKISEPYDIVITVFQDNIQDVPHRELKGQLKKQLKESGIIK